MLSVFVVMFACVVALGFGVSAAWSDIKSMTIPNSYSIFITVSFVISFLFVSFFAKDTEYFFSWQNHVIAGFAIFAITYGLFFFGLIGGGDAKLLSAFAFWVGLQGLMPMLFYMAIVGGLLGAVTLLLGRFKPLKTTPAGSWLEKAQNGEKKIPYGIAIFIGALMAFLHNGYISIEGLQSFLEVSGV